jgi:hypothetical protein
VKKMKKKSRTIFICVSVTLITCYIIWWYNDTHTGSRSGMVIDAITGKPIEGAVVNFSSEFVVFMGNPLGGNFTRIREVLTGNKGKYFIPGFYEPKRLILIDGSFIEEGLLVYKYGYAVYEAMDLSGARMIGRSFGYAERQKCSKKNNIIKLYPLKEGVSHEKHISLIDFYTSKFGATELLVKELKKEYELARQEAIERSNHNNNIQK